MWKTAGKHLLVLEIASVRESQVDTDVGEIKSIVWEIEKEPGWAWG